MNLTQKPEVTEVQAKHFLYVEKIGPFMETARSAWEECYKVFMTMKDVNKVGAIAMFKMKPEMIYRAGFIIDGKPEHLPAGIQYMKFDGGKFSKFVLTGSYENLGQAWGQTMQNIETQNLPLRDAFFFENYVNDPMTTPVDQLKTELMVPTK